MDHKKKTFLSLLQTDILPAVLIGIAALALYIRTLAPSLLWGDSAEFQTLSYTLGMSHPSGYMTQIMLGKLFTYIPVGNIAYRVNLMSAFLGALAVGEMYLIVRLLGGRKTASISSCLMLMLFPLFWRSALIAESYAPAAGMITTIWLFFLLWRKTGTWIYLFIAGVVGGLSVGIHSTVVMTAASILVTMIITARKRSEWFAAVSGAFIGLLITVLFFFYLDHNDPPSSIYNTVYRINLSTFGLRPNDFDTPLERFFTIFPASHFWSYYFSASSQVIERRLVEYLSFFPIWAVVLIPVGAVELLKRNWRDGLYPLISFSIIWVFAVTVSFSVYREFYTPVAVFAYVWFGLGANASLDWMDRILKRNELIRRSMQVLLPILLILLPLWQARIDLQLAVFRGYTSFVRQDHLYPIFAKDKAIQDANKILNHVDHGAIVFADWDKLYSYIYTAQIVNNRTDISFHEAWSGDEMELSESALAYIEKNIDSHPIYFAVDMPGLEQNYHVVKINDLLQQIYRK